MIKTSLLPQSERLRSLDVLRGIAVLGILIMNIQSFAMISAAYNNPMAYGDVTGLNKTVWVFSHYFADQKFLSIFSMLFGVGILIFSDNAKRKGYLPTRFYYRRLFWLFAFGLVHGYLFWHGDILVMFAMAGAFAYLFRRFSPGLLFALGGVIFLIPVFNMWLFGKSITMWPAEAVLGLKENWAPGQQAIDGEIAAMTGSFKEELAWRIPESYKMQTFVFIVLLGWRIISMMLVGMALHKWGVLTATFGKGFYVLMAVVCLSIGFLFIDIGVNKNFAANWSVEYSMFFGVSWNYVGSFFVALGYIAIVMMLCQRFSMGLLAKVGRLAFSNYILMTLLCTTIFYGHGFGLFGSVERIQQLIIVFAIWVLILVFSFYWSKSFYYGPIEWLWRYLTYGNKPMFKKDEG